MQGIIFLVVAAVSGIAAVRLVTNKNLVHAALYLVVTLMGMAVIFLLLTAEFVAWVQVLIYVGAVIVLL
ncbi:MAG: NADH-quinone oxidoreductase subunit J, partial [Actinomycetota bacterium]